MGTRLNPNSDAWAGAWGTTWAGSWGWSWGPLHEVEEELEPAGHLKHLFRGIQGAKTPAVSGPRLHARAQVKLPIAVQKLTVPAVAPHVACSRISVRSGASLATGGGASPAITRRVKMRSGRAAVSAAAAAPFVRHSGVKWRSGVSSVTAAATTPPCPATLAAYGGKASAFGVKNPTYEMLLAVL